MENLEVKPLKKSHLGLGVVAVMSLKGTATLTAAFLLPTWPMRLVALGAIVAIAVYLIVRHRRRRKLGDTPQA